MKIYLKLLLLVPVAAAFIAFSGKNFAHDAKGGTAGTEGDSAVNPNPVVVTACTADTGITRIICLSNAFKAQLTPGQLAKVQLAYSVGDAQRWSNLPQAFLRGNEARPGLGFGEMTTVQIKYAKALVKAVSGTSDNEGWDELQQLLNADEYLGQNGGGRMYGADNYNIALLGTPAATGTY